MESAPNYENNITIFICGYCLIYIAVWAHGSWCNKPINNNDTESESKLENNELLDKNHTREKCTYYQINKQMLANSEVTENLIHYLS